MPCLIIFLRNKQGFVRRSKTLTTSTRQCFPNTYPCILGRILCPEERWKLQRLVKVVEYFAASLDYFRLSHWFWRHSSRILCTFISEGRMFPKLKRLDPTAYKGEDHMITGDSFILPICNGSEDALNLLATRSITRPVFLDLGGHQELFLEVEIQSSRHETRISSTRVLYPLDHTLSTHPESQGGVSGHIRQRGKVWWHSRWEQG